jgi:hypothetical protein
VDGTRGDPCTIRERSGSDPRLRRSYCAAGGQITLDNAQNRGSVGKIAEMVHAEIVGTGLGDPIRSGGGGVRRDPVRGKAVRPNSATA